MKSLSTLVAAAGVFALAAAAPANAGMVYDLTFDELINTPVTVPGVTVEGVTVSYFGPGTGATYGFGVSPSIYPGIDTPFLEGDANGTIAFSFDQPVSDIMFNIGLQTFFDNAIDYTVTIFYTGDMIPDVEVDRDITSFGALPYEKFSYSAPGMIIDSFQVSFNADVNRFAIDNLTTVPEASTLGLVALASCAGFAGLALRRRKAA